MKVSFEVNQSKLFDMVAGHGTQSIVGDILGHLLTGKSGFGPRIRLEIYGIEPLEDQSVLAKD